MFKKTLSLILAIAMLCTLVPFAAIAEEATAELNPASEELSATLAASTKASQSLDTSAFDAVISGTTVQLPATIANYNFSADDYKNFTADQTAVNEIKNSNTYFLLDSATTSNFTAVEGTANVRTRREHPWVDNLNTVNSPVPVEPETTSSRTATIYVPADGQYQVVYHRWAYYDGADKVIGGTSAADARDVSHWYPSSSSYRYLRMSVDGKPVSYTNGISGETGETLHNLFKLKTYHDSGLMVATGSPADNAQSFIEWGPCFNLTAGFHTIQLDYTAGGAYSGVILTNKVGYDWSKIYPFPNVSVFELAYNANYLSATRNATTALGLIDTTAPQINGNVEQNSDRQDTTATINLPGITNDTKAVYKIEFTDNNLGFEPQIIPATQPTFTFTGLQERTTYQIKVTPIDYLGNTGTAQTVSVMTKYPNVPFFADGKITNTTSITDANADTKIDVQWTSAQYYGQGNYAYNVYLDGVIAEGGENVNGNTFSFTGLTAGTEYNVKVVTTMDETNDGTDNFVECEEDICVLEASFYTAKAPTATLVNATDTTATIKVRGKFSPAEDYEFSNSVVASNTNSYTATIDGDVITVTGLTPATKYDLEISFNENKKGEVATRINTVPLKFSTMNSLPIPPAPEAIYPEYLIEKGIFVQHDMKIGDTPTQAQSNAIAAAEAQHKWGAYTDDAGTKSALWFEAQYCYGSNGSTVEVPLYFPDTGDYYVFAHGSDNGNGVRGINVAVDGVAVKKDGTAFKFGTTGTSYCDEVVNVTQGDHTITITQISGYRLDMVTFVPKAEVDEAGGPNDFKDINMSKKEKFEQFAKRYKVEKVFLEDGSGISVEETSQKVLEISLFPSVYANKLDGVKYKLYLNNKLVATLEQNETTYVVDSGDGVLDGKNTIKVEAVVGETVNSFDTLVYDVTAITAIATVVKDANDIISSGVVTLVAPPYMTGTKDVHVLIVAYKNNRMQKIQFTTKTMSASGYEPVSFTVSGEPAKWIDSVTANDPAVRSVKLYVLDENFLPIELTY